MKRFLRLIAIASLAGAGTPALAQSKMDGLWLNPRGTVAVRAGDCGGKLCGWIEWAAPQAQADARDSGIADLKGIELLEDYVPDGAGSWSGSVYVPDMGHHFASTITQVGASELKVQGCLIGGFICKTQIWQRIEKVPNA